MVAKQPLAPLIFAYFSGLMNAQVDSVSIENLKHIILFVRDFLLLFLTENIV